MSQRARFKDPIEEALFEALCLDYWGDKEGARALMSRITEKVLARDVSEETTQAAPERVSFPPEDDIDWDAAAGADLYPWDGWQFQDSKQRS